MNEIRMSSHNCLAIQMPIPAGVPPCTLVCVVLCVIRHMPDYCASWNHAMSFLEDRPQDGMGRISNAQARRV